MGKNIASLIKELNHLLQKECKKDSDVVRRRKQIRRN